MLGKISSSPRFQSLTLFTSIYGIGPHTARRLYALGLRTLEHLELYYGVDRSETNDHPQEAPVENETPLRTEDPLIEIEEDQEMKEENKRRYFASKNSSERSGPEVKGRGGDDSELGEGWVKVALGLREDLMQK